MDISNFFSTMYIDASSYECLRKIASVSDGLKNSGRKVIYTVLDKNLNSSVKVSRLKSTVSEHTEYIHGEDNLSPVIVNLARRYTGSNNLPLLKEDGNFGKRFIPESSADRYISTSVEKYLSTIFHKDDNEILVKQEFEGTPIEPRYLVPVIPMLLVNGAMGIAIGFAQLILPRPLPQIIKMTETFIDTGKVKVPKPGWSNFNGTIENDTVNKRKWIVSGAMNIVNSTTIDITEIPIGITLKDYQNILDDLKDNKVISDYEDRSENDIFNFRVRVTRNFSSMSEKDILSALKLRDADKRFVENYTTMGVDNRILLSETPEELFLTYAKIREEFYTKRKENIIKQLNEDIIFLVSKISFIKNVTEDNIIISKRTKSEIISQLSNFNEIKEFDGGYDYLLRLPIYSLTKEKIDELMNKMSEKKSELETIQSKTEKQLWKDDLEALKKSIK